MTPSRFVLLSCLRQTVCLVPFQCVHVITHSREIFRYIYHSSTAAAAAAAACCLLPLSMHLPLYEVRSYWECTNKPNKHSRTSHLCDETINTFRGLLILVERKINIDVWVVENCCLYRWPRNLFENQKLIYLWWIHTLAEIHAVDDGKSKYEVISHSQPFLILITVQQDATVFSLLHFCRQLYMFRVLTPIIRSSYSCNYCFWHWSAGSSREFDTCYQTVWRHLSWIILPPSPG